MKILESSENYLETILLLQKRKGNARSIDIAKELSFSKASVSVAMKQLRENNYISIEDSGNIILLPKGAAIAEKMYERHVLLTSFLEKLGIEPTTAREDACKIEHIISDETFDALKALASKL